MSDNAALVVSLSLQGHGIDVSRVRSVEDLAAHSVALVDVAPNEDATAVASTIPEGVARVLIVSGVEKVGGARLVQRPYSMAELVGALRDAFTESAADSQNHALAGDAAAVLPGPPRWSAQEPSPLQPDSPFPAPSFNIQEVPADPIGRVAHAAAELGRLLEEAPFLRSTEHFADAVAATLAEDLQAVNVTLWRPGEAMEVLGCKGLTDSERRARPHKRHPLLEQARGEGGLILADTEAGSPLVLGIPGARTPYFVVVCLESGVLPVEIVTLGLNTADAGLPDHVEIFMNETALGWRATAAVEELVDGLRH